MKYSFLLSIVLITIAGIAIATAQAKILSADPMTGLPLISATDSGKGYGNDPNQMPQGQVCRGKMKGDFYSLYNIKMDAAVSWYSAHLSGFKKVQGYESGRSQAAFYNPAGTIVVFVTADAAPQGQNADAYAVAYELYEPGISEKTIAGLTQGKMVCQ